MHANGCLRRPLWDAVKSIGGGRLAREQRRGLHHPPVPPAAAAAATGRTNAKRGKPRATRQDARKARPERDATGRQTTAAGGESPSPPPPAERGPLRRVLVGEEASDVPRTNANGDFEAVVQSATAGPVDYKALRYPQRSGEQPHARYFSAYRDSLQHRLRKQAFRWQRNQQRYGMFNSRNWRAAVDLLEKATPDGPSRHQRRMETVSLQGGLHGIWRKAPGEVILEIMQQTGSHLQAPPLRSTAGTFTSVTLWGTAAQNEHARRLLTRYVDAVDPEDNAVAVYGLDHKVLPDLDVARASSDAFGPASDPAADSAGWREHDDVDDAEMERLEDALGDITNSPGREPAPIRAVWAPSAVSIRGRPPRWNQLTFAAYVDSLTSPMSRLAQRRLYGPQSPRSTQAHVETMIQELTRVFHAPESKPFASPAAFDVAICFFMKHNNFPAARSIFLSLEDIDFTFTASNFESLLDVASREESVPNFIYPLRLMIAKGLRPTVRAWTALRLLMARRFPLEATIVTELMRRKGLLANIDTVKTVAADNADREIATHLALSKDLEDFILSAESTYGEIDMWMSARFTNKVARVLLERGLCEEATALVRRLEAVTRPKGRAGADTATMNTFLTSCLRGADMSGALAYVRMFMPVRDAFYKSTPSTPLLQPSPIGRFADEPFAIRPDHITFGILFSIAWKNRYFNVLRVLWRHACTAGTVSFKTQAAVMTSLTMAPWGQRVTNKTQPGDMKTHGLWNTLAGKFAVGAKYGLPNEGVQSREAAAQARALKNTRRPVDRKSKSFEHLMPNVSALTRWTKLDIGYARFAKFFAYADMNETGSLRPVNPLLHDLERAWRLDILWKEEGLGTWAGIKKVREEEESMKSETVKKERVKKEGPKKKGPKKEGPVKEEAETKSEEGEIEGADQKDTKHVPQYVRDQRQAREVRRMFQEMLARGVRVPMEVGDAAGVSAMSGLVENNRRQK